jgi:hypothetical protein
MAIHSHPPTHDRAAVELIMLAMNADNPTLALTLFEAHTPEERDRISMLVRGKIMRAIRVARSRRV